MAEQQNHQVPDFAPHGLATVAISLHELYMSYKDAGFSRDQAFKLTCVALGEGIRNGLNGHQG